MERLWEMTMPQRVIAQKHPATKRSFFRKKLNGVTTVTGINVSKVHDHACDRMAERNIDADTVKDVIETATITYPGNKEDRICYQKGNCRVVISKETGIIISVVDLEED